jgi:hypothetical protein
MHVDSVARSVNSEQLTLSVLEGTGPALVILPGPDLGQVLYRNVFPALLLENHPE